MNKRDDAFLVIFGIWFLGLCVGPFFISMLINSTWLIQLRQDLFQSIPYIGDQLMAMVDVHHEGYYANGRFIRAPYSEAQAQPTLLFWALVLAFGAVFATVTTLVILVGLSIFEWTSSLLSVEGKHPDYSSDSSDMKLRFRRLQFRRALRQAEYKLEVMPDENSRQVTYITYTHSDHGGVVEPWGEEDVYGTEEKQAIVERRANLQRDIAVYRDSLVDIDSILKSRS